MDITTEYPASEVAVITLAGELDGSNFEQVIDAGRTARDSGAQRIVMDLTGLSYMGSSGLVAIHSIALILAGQEPTSPEDGWQAIHEVTQSVEGGPGVILAGPQPAVERVLVRSGMVGLFPVHPDRETALGAAAV